MKCEQLFYSTAEVFAGGVAEPHPTQWNLPEGGGVPPLTLWKKPEVDGYTRSVRGNPGGSRTPSSRSSRQHTKRGPYRGWSKHHDAPRLAKTGGKAWRQYGKSPFAKIQKIAYYHKRQTLLTFFNHWSFKI